MAKIVGYRSPDGLGKIGPIHRFVYGNTTLNFETAYTQLSMFAALVAIGYVGYVTVKELRGGKRGR